ncbi:phage terminase small subunit [Bacillus anthracis]|uniref:phage terminase small subunit n=1 Tax=Bacillus anthracis TaxID=1392 RepID=UPI002DB6B1CC|nr:phage terminase small subunit [Bacillus anthracis]MEB9454206.1 phage terminase small subunit [Bacillus anthracis]
MKQKHELAQEDYMQGMKYKDIAEKHDVSVNTVKSWKTRYKWDRKGVHTNNEKVRTQKKTGAPVGNKNAIGNPGNKNPKWGNKNAVGHGAPLQNDNAVTHGFFRKHFPEDVADLAAEIMEKNPIDMLWENITIQYTAIIRAQRLMFVESKNEMIKELKKSKFDVLPDKEKGFIQVPTEEEYEFQFAWDRHATFMNAQSRAMSTLSSLIRDFDKLANIDDERRLKLETMKLNVKKVEAEVKKLSGSGNDGPIEIIVKRKGDD